MKPWLSNPRIRWDESEWRMVSAAFRKAQIQFPHYNMAGWYAEAVKVLPIERQRHWARGMGKKLNGG